MIKPFDILVVIIEMTLFFILGVTILTTTDYPFLVLPLLLSFIFIHIIIKRQKRILNYVTDDFRKLGFELTDEKPIPFFDSDFSVKPTIIVNGLPISRYGYIRQFERIFTAINADGEEVELKAVVTKKWSGENHLEIKSEKIIS